jgi:hypothetical protein
MGSFNTPSSSHFSPSFSVSVSSSTPTIVDPDQRDPHIVYWNVQSLLNSSRLTGIKAFLTSPSRPLVLAMCETWPHVLRSELVRRNTPGLTVESICQVPGYSLLLPSQFPSSRNLVSAPCKGYGGLGFYFRDDLSYDPVPLPESTLCGQSVSQVCWIRLLAPVRVIVGVIYVSREVTAQDRQLLSDSILAVTQKYASDPIILGGDFNTQLKDWMGTSNFGSHSWLYDVVEASQLVNMNMEHCPGVVTRPRNHVASNSPSSPSSPPSSSPSSSTCADGTIIDWVFASSTDSIDHMDVGNISYLQSDHLPLALTLKPTLFTTPLLNCDLSLAYRFRIPQINSPLYFQRGQQFRELLVSRMQEWISIWTDDKLDRSSRSDLELSWNQLMSILLRCGAAVYALPSRLSHRATPDYFFRDPRVLAAIATCHRAFSAFRRSPTPRHAHQRDVAVRERDNMIKLARREYWASFQDELEDNQSRIIWSIWHRSKGAGSKTISNVKNKQGVAPASKQESLNNLASFFAEVSDVRSVPADEKMDASVTAAVGHSDFRSPAGFGSLHYSPSHPFYPVTESLWTLKEIKSACKHAPMNTALGPDSIHPVFLRFGGGCLHLALQRLFNASWKAGYVFHSLRVSNVVALFKKGDRSNPNNYRPISLTSVVARMYERLVQPRLMKIVEPQLHQYQFGFRPKRSTYDNLLHIQRQIHAAMLFSTAVPVAFLDLCKAFDRVHHASLLYKLGNMGVKASLWSFLQAFLHDRQMRCQDGDLFSDWHSVHSGVPQGSVLGPSLFLIYINDLLSAITTATGGRDQDITSPALVQPLAFADDLALTPDIDRMIRKALANPDIWQVHSDLDSLVKSVCAHASIQLQLSLNCCSEWAKLWRMSFSKDKSQVVFFSRQGDSTHSFQLSSFIMDIVKSYPYLGLVLHAQGKVDEHASALRLKLTRVSNFTRRILSSRRHAHVAHVLTNATVRATFSYALPFWSPSPQSFAHMNSCLAAAYRTVLSLPRSTPVLALLSQFGTPSSQAIKEYLTIRFAIRCLTLPPSHPSYISFRQQVWNAKVDPANPYIGPLVSATRGKYENVPAHCVSLLLQPNHPWGDIHCQSPEDVLRYLSAPASVTSIDDHLPVRAKTVWSSTTLKHLDPNSSGHNWCLQHCDTPGITYQSYLKYDNPRIAALRSRLRLQRAHTNQYRSKFHLPSPTLIGENCAHCGVMETVEHVLMVCPLYSASRLLASKQLQRLQASPRVLIPPDPVPVPSLSVSPSLTASTTVLFPFSLPTVLGFVPFSLHKSRLLPAVFHITSSFLSSIRAVRFL